MKIVGLTGGIGSGKTTVARMFETLGVPVYIADDEAKKLMNTSKVIKRKLIQLLTEKAYTEGVINRKYVADVLFNNPDILQKVNKIVHPKVGAHFNKWVKKQTTPYCIKEAAILFENDGYKKCDLTILVTSSEEERIKRVMLRDNTTRKAVKERIRNQWTDAQKAALADIIIKNNDIETTRKEVGKIHASLI